MRLPGTPLFEIGLGPVGCGAAGWAAGWRGRLAHFRGSAGASHFMKQGPEAAMEQPQFHAKHA